MRGMVFRSRKIGFLSVILLFLFGGVVFASLDFSPNQIDFGGDGVDPEEVKSATVSLSNNYPEYNLTDFIVEFIPDDSLNGNPVSDGDFDYSSIGEIENMSEEDLDIDFTIPPGLSAIDEDFDGKRFGVGEINVTATAINTTSGSEDFLVSVMVPVTLQVGNRLEFYKNKVEIEIGSEDPKNISSGTTQEAYEGDNVKLKVFFENSFSDDKFKFDDGDVNVTLYVDGDEIEIEDSNALIEGGEFDSVEFDFDLDGYDVDEKYDVLLELRGIEANGGLHGELFEFEFEIVEDETSGNTNDLVDSDNDGVADNIDLCPGTLTGCHVDEAGCELDTDSDGMCNGWDKYPNGGDIVKKENNDVKLEADKKEDDKEVDEKENNGVEEEKKKPEDNSDGLGNIMSFIFGLIVGVIGAVCFFVLTKV